MANLSLEAFRLASQSKKNESSYLISNTVATDKTFNVSIFSALQTDQPTPSPDLYLTVKGLRTKKVEKRYLMSDGFVLDDQDPCLHPHRHEQVVSARPENRWSCAALFHRCLSSRRSKEIHRNESDTTHYVRQTFIKEKRLRVRTDIQLTTATTMRRNICISIYKITTNEGKTQTTKRTVCSEIDTHVYVCGNRFKDLGKRDKSLGRWTTNN